MTIRVTYHDGQLELEGPGDRLVAAFEPPAGPPGDLRRRVLDALETPIDYPPLRQVVVPGDQVVVPVDPSLPDASTVLACVAEVLREVGVGSIAAVVDGRHPERTAVACPPDVELVVHDPDDRESLAYLASTTAGRRIYVNRRVADADAVIPIGRIGPDDALGLRGPWSVIDPALTDAGPASTSLLGPARGADERLAESLEVSWLLGSQFQVGGIPGDRGLLDVLAGQTSALRDRAATLLEASWTLHADDRADLVVAGLGGPGRPAGPDDLIAGLHQALRVVRRGGKVALLSRLGIDAIREAARSTALPRGDWDKAVAFADVYLASSAEADALDELGLIPLDRPEQAAKLARLAPSFLAIGQADRALASTDAAP